MIRASLYTTLLVVFILNLCRSAVIKSTGQSSSSVNQKGTWSLNQVPLSRQRRDSLLKINPDIRTIAANIPSIPMAVRLFWKTQKFLQISDDGVVNGTAFCSSKYANLELEPMGSGFQRIKGIETGRYVAMNSGGIVYSTNSTNDETVFKLTMESTSYHTFASAKYYKKSLYDTFISLGRNGKIRKGKDTKVSQNKVKFIIYTGDSCWSPYFEL